MIYALLLLLAGAAGYKTYHHAATWYGFFKTRHTAIITSDNPLYNMEYFLDMHSREAVWSLFATCVFLLLAYMSRPQ